MRIKGTEIPMPQEEVVVIPREPENFVFTLKPVLDFSKFEEMCPEPTPPKKTFPGGREETDYENPTFRDKLEDWSRKRGHWIQLESLSATEGLEWETVELSDPETWKNYADEMQKTLSPSEFMKIIQAISVACGLDSSKIEEATANFLADREKTQSE
jgi:hypothetical protein